MTLPAENADSTKDTRLKIVEAALEVIIEHGVRGTTHRRVAQKANLSPGTLTYRYKNIDALLHDAFSYMIDEIATAFRLRLEQAKNIAEAREAVADLICGAIWATPRHLMLSFELYALASRQENFRALLQTWMMRSRTSLHLHFSAETSWTLDALIEGYTIHNFLNDAPMGRERILHSITLLTG